MAEGDERAEKNYEVFMVSRLQLLWHIFHDHNWRIIARPVTPKADFP